MAETRQKRIHSLTFNKKQNKVIHEGHKTKHKHSTTDPRQRKQLGLNTQTKTHMGDNQLGTNRNQNYKRLQNTRHRQEVTKNPIKGKHKLGS